ncbi:MAG TPA: hypothetical protein PLN96_11765 [Zoogloea sp.]|uniref:hypothetical protein n=1 Tax=Zoogloea sp. TaxID=49181 RepID=UPI002C0402D3|nr:hypothetical protein [Zoogloea sp.]HMV61925.1 hypothetical protein [Rhodocyclaceae bacterium]HMW50669.1 hypothetical protein [Rhodocyclaceae bacterium]HMY49327.1 hypothetical protein [Rhodocyclaceae bacterium]HMZ74737.1 hypothetical protein [Rhodocyclaceae bacterium]HNA66933.1 hypothetical protein [Rhodocyclaceae bacterium]
MLLWRREVQPVVKPVPEAVPVSAQADYEEKRQRALQILGERWLLHRANAPDRRPVRSVLGGAAGRPLS